MSEEICKSIESLVDTIEHMQNRLSAHQLLLIAILGLLEEQPEQRDRMKRILGQMWNGVQATNLNLPLTDEALLQQKEALLKMLPPAFQACVTD